MHEGWNPLTPHRCLNCEERCIWKGTSFLERRPWPHVFDAPNEVYVVSLVMRDMTHTVYCEKVSSEQQRWWAIGGGYKPRGSSCVRACSNYLFSTNVYCLILTHDRSHTSHLN